MKPTPHSFFLFACAMAAMIVLAAPARAVGVTPGGGAVALPGTNAVADPDLNGTLLASQTTNWVSAIDPMYGFPGAEGTLDATVYRSTSTGTLDFYWSYHVNGPSYPSYTPQQLLLSSLDLSAFGTGASFDANFRTDQGGTAPLDAISASTSTLSFEFGSAMGPGSTSSWLLLHSTATAFDTSALAKLGVTTVSTFAPTAAVPETSTYALMFAGLGLVGFVMQRRRAIAG